MRIRPLTPALLGLVLSGCAVAQAPKAEEDHSAHHPPGVAATAQPPAPAAPGTAPSTDAFERQVKAMQDMHQRMQAARTPAERAALMDEHTKLMQSGMAMMGRMRSGPGGGGTGAGPGMGMGMGMGMGSGTGMGMAPPGGQARPGTPPAAGPGMGGMGGMGGMMGMHQHMDRRMAMMEHMMQMMVDREAAMPRP